MRNKLIAEYGFCYIKVNRQENEDVILVKKVLLSKHDKKENWMLITEEEGIKLRDEVSARLMAEMEAESERIRIEQDATR